MGSEMRPFIRITEQPASKALRFRYECEGRSAGSIPGARSTPEIKTYPTIEIVNYKGPVVVIVSCVTKDFPYKPHPHNLVGRDGCKNGYCSVEVHNETMSMSFDHLGIQCVKKKDIDEALKVREGYRIDPFGTGFKHGTQPIDLNAVRLAFQAIIKNGKIPLKAVATDIIYDKKALCDLTICKLSHCAAPVAGGMEMILLCEKVAKEDISVVFFEERNGNKEWEAVGEFTPTQVHKQVAISFKTPKYRTIQVDNPVHVKIQLRRPSDGETSDALPFLLTPLDSGSPSGEIPRKKAKVNHGLDRPMVVDQDPLCIRLPAGSSVKREPNTSPNPYLLVQSPGMHYRSSPPLDFSQGVPFQYNAPASSPLNPQLSGVRVPGSLPPPVSPHLVYNLSHDTTPIAAFAQVNVDSPPAILPDIHQANTYITLAPVENLASMENLVNLNLSSRDLSAMSGLDDGRLSESLSINLSLNGELNQLNRVQDNNNMTDSFDKLCNRAYSEFEG